MKIAQRAERIEPFYVMEVAKAAATLAKEFAHTTKPMIFLNIGEPDFTASPLVVQAASAAIGICASKDALTATSANSNIAEKTAASGVRAPACKLGMERFMEPQDT